MNKREYLVRLLETIKDVWDPAEGFLIVLKAWGFDDDIVDTLIRIIEESIKETKDTLEKKKLEWSIVVLEKLRSMEESSNQKDNDDCEELLDQLEML